MKNSRSSAPSHAIAFYIAKLPLEKLPQDIYFKVITFAKTIITCENNYGRENNWRFIVDVWQGSDYASDFEYSSFPNIAGFWIEQGYEYAGVLNTLLDLNMSGLCICHSFKYVMVTYGSKYAWICLNNSWICLK